LLVGNEEIKSKWVMVPIREEDGLYWLGKEWWDYPGRNGSTKKLGLGWSSMNAMRGWESSNDHI
jgi:hypothetical protein